MKKLLLCVIALLFMLTACKQTNVVSPSAPGTAPSQQPSESKKPTDEIIIGNIQDLSGGAVFAGTQMKWGVEKAVADVNAAGGINGKKIKLITYDCKLDANEAVNVYHRLVEDGAVAIVGPPLSGVAITLAPVAEEAKVPIVGQFMDERATTNEQTGAPWSYMFLAQPSSPQQGVIIARYAANELGIKSVGVLYDSGNAYAVSHAKPFMEYMESKGIKVSSETFTSDSKDYKAQLSKLIALNYDAMFFPSYEDANALAYVQARNLGYTGWILGNNCFIDPFPELVGDGAKMEKVFFVDNVDMNSEYTKALAQAYRDEFGSEPVVNICFGYDSTMIIVNALKNVKDTSDPIEITQYIKHNTKDVVTTEGLISLDPSTHRTIGMGAFIATYDEQFNKTLVGYYLPID